MSKKLYIGNLPYNSTDQDLESEFSSFGTVEDAKVIIDKMTGRSRGFGFVTITEDDGADQAIEKMNGKDMDGRPLVVNEARPMTDRPSR